MFSLIIVISSILLVTVLAVATIYYGGRALNSGEHRAGYAQSISEGAQISGAAALHFAREEYPAPDIPALLESNYLKSNPMQAWGSFKDTAYLPGIPEERCTAINANLKIKTPPACSDPITVGRTLCCVNE